MELVAPTSKHLGFLQHFPNWKCENSWRKTTGVTTETNCFKWCSLTRQHINVLAGSLSCWWSHCELSNVKPRGTIWLNYTNEGMESSHLSQPTKYAPSPQINSHASPQPTCKPTYCMTCLWFFKTATSANTNSVVYYVHTSAWLQDEWHVAGSEVPKGSEGLLGMEVKCGAFLYFFLLAPIVRNGQSSYSNYDPGWYPYCQAQNFALFFALD